MPGGARTMVENSKASFASIGGKRLQHVPQVYSLPPDYWLECKGSNRDCQRKSAGGCPIQFESGVFNPYDGMRNNTPTLDCSFQRWPSATLSGGRLQLNALSPIE